MFKTLTVVLLLLLSACSNDSITISKDKYNQLTGVIPKSFTVDGKTYLIYTGSDGHDYYKIHTYYHDNYLHHSGCPLCNKSVVNAPLKIKQ